VNDLAVNTHVETFHSKALTSSVVAKFVLIRIIDISTSLFITIWYLSLMLETADVCEKTTLVAKFLTYKVPLLTTI
jgi:hypothetical protein